jgi:hypothetical protein
VTITAPVTGLSRRLDGRGWAYAMYCHHRPDRRFALGGELTAWGLEEARRLLADLSLDWAAVTRHGGEVDAACRRARRELAEVAGDFDGRAAPLHRERADLRLAFRAGRLPQREYQARRKAAGRGLGLVDADRREAERSAGLRFTAWAEKHCGRRQSLEEAERLLTEAALVVEAPRPG